jgi:hypothetical protein
MFNIFDEPYQEKTPMIDCSNLVDFKYAGKGDTTKATPLQVTYKSDDSKTQCKELIKLHNLNALMPKPCEYLFKANANDKRTLACNGQYTGPTSSNPAPPYKPKVEKISMTWRWVIIGIAIALILGAFIFIYLEVRKENKLKINKNFQF